MQIYEPEEDSYLISFVLKKNIPLYLKKNPDLSFFEVGAGGGINLECAKKSGVKNIHSCDINLSAVKHCKKLGFSCVKSDLFSNINNKFDLIIFNPPYLPLDKKEPKNSRVATTGGIKGSEIINKFLRQAKDYLKKNGKIILLVSSLTKDIDFLDYKKKLLERKKLFFEELFVWELK
jgi:release factor glutamine methyltransferase